MAGIGVPITAAGRGVREPGSSTEEIRHTAALLALLKEWWRYTECPSSQEAGEVSQKRCIQFLWDAQVTRVDAGLSCAGLWPWLRHSLQARDAGGSGKRTRRKQHCDTRRCVEVDIHTGK